MSITIYHVSDKYHEIGERCAEPLGTSMKYRYKHCILTELNRAEDLLSVPLQYGSFPDYITSLLPPTMQPLIVATIQDANNLPAVVLHPLYPGRELIISHQQDIHNGLFGSLFSVPSQGRDDYTYGRPLSGEELLLCYSVPPEVILNQSA